MIRAWSVYLYLEGSKLLLLNPLRHILHLVTLQTCVHLVPLFVCLITFKIAVND